MLDTEEAKIRGACVCVDTRHQRSINRWLVDAGGASTIHSAMDLDQGLLE